MYGTKWYGAEYLFSQNATKRNTSEPADLTLCMLLLSSADFFNINFKKIFQEQFQSFK